MRPLFRGENIVAEGTLLNLSEGGCAMKSSASISRGAYLEICVLLPRRSDALEGRTRRGALGGRGMFWLRIH